MLTVGGQQENLFEILRIDQSMHLSTRSDLMGQEREKRLIILHAVRVFLQPRFTSATASIPGRAGESQEAPSLQVLLLLCVL